MFADLLCLALGHLKFLIPPFWYEGWQPCARCGRWVLDRQEMMAGTPLTFGGLRRAAPDYHPRRPGSAFGGVDLPAPSDSGSRVIKHADGVIVIGGRGSRG